MSGKKIDLIGQRFGKLFVESSGTPKESKDRSYITWRCLCDCGNYIETITNCLTKGRSLSCGCSRQDIKPREDISGQRYGNLVVVGTSHRNKHNAILWLCKCDCGNEKLVLSSEIKSGKIQSCGCLWKDRICQKGELHFKWNPNLTDQDRKYDRYCPEYSEWRKLVFERDNYICKKCNKKTKSLNAHHIENYSSNLEKRTLLSNGITLCEDCHNDFHHQYSKYNNNYEQLNKFLNKGDENY